MNPERRPVSRSAGATEAAPSIMRDRAPDWLKPSTPQQPQDDATTTTNAAHFLAARSRPSTVGSGVPRPALADAPHIARLSPIGKTFVEYKLRPSPYVSHLSQASPALITLTERLEAERRKRQETESSLAGLQDLVDRLVKERSPLYAAPDLPPRPSTGSASGSDEAYLADMQTLLAQQALKLNVARTEMVGRSELRSLGFKVAGVGSSFHSRNPHPRNRQLQHVPTRGEEGEARVRVCARKRE